MERLPSLDELEEQTSVETINREQEVLNAIEQLLNQYIAGFRLLGKSKVTHAEGQELVWSSLTLRAFKSFRWAYHLLQRGYYSQSMMLTRSGYEDWLVCMDCISYDETVDALLDGGRRVPTFRDMSERLPESLKKEWTDYGGVEGLYGFLSTFSHPRYRTLVQNIDPEQRSFRVTPSFDQSYFLVTSYYLLQGALRMLEFLARLVHPIILKSTDEVQLIMNQANDCLDQLIVRANTLSEGAKQGE